jgi:hypothetical protein
MLTRIFLVLLWWIGMWGLIDLFIQKFTRGNFVKSVIAYSSIIGVVLVILSMNPEMIEFF